MNTYLDIIADSGSTKTQWAIGHSNIWRTFITVGLNPRVTSDDIFRDTLEILRREVKNENCNFSNPNINIHFYGAGCGSYDMQKLVENLIREYFPTAMIEVAGDMIGACKIVCGRNNGVVAILGTGSNACFYDGEKILRQVPSTGWVLGDEGSGNHIGRRLVKDYITGRMPSDLTEMFSQQFTEDYAEIMHNIYKKPFPNRYLASLTTFAAKYRDTPYIKKVLRDVFTHFWEEQIMPITHGKKENIVSKNIVSKNSPLLDEVLNSPTEVTFVGGVAAAFENELRESTPQGYHVGRVVKSPIEYLVGKKDNATLF